MISRRQALKYGVGLSGLALSNCTLGGDDKTSITTKPDIGVQLYTARDLFQHDAGDTLWTLAEIGYTDIEFADYYDHDPPELRRIMDDLGLISRSRHIPYDDFVDNFEQALETAAIFSQTYQGLGWIPPRARASLDTYKKLADQLNVRGQLARQAGMAMVYHNHGFEFEPIEGQRPYDLLLERTEPNLVSMQPDFYWMHQAGVDPIDYFKKAPGRFTLCHMKDAKADGTMTDVGAGVIDFARIIAHAELAGLKHYYAEHDEPANPIQSLRESYGTLKGLLS